MRKLTNGSLKPAKSNVKNPLEQTPVFNIDLTGKVLKTEYNVEAEGDNLSDDISENNI
tara:strand:- start:411 stop:584 length:174 start_codon:yes stop_codon:yes gene_type:complete